MANRVIRCSGSRGTMALAGAIKRIARARHQPRESATSVINQGTVKFAVNQ
jgi:hypothetical protein